MSGLDWMRVIFIASFALVAWTFWSLGFWFGVRPATLPTVSSGWIPVVNVLFVILVVLVPAVFMRRWARKCIRRVSSDEKPTQAIRLYLGKPVQVHMPGRLWIGIWPVETFRMLPLAPYKFPYTLVKVYSLETPGPNGLSSQPIKGKVALYFQWPIADLAYGGEQGEVLIRRGYYRFPAINLLTKEADVALGKFLEETILGAARQVMAQRSHEQCRSQKEAIEREMKEYLLREPGNPIHEMCIPAECLDIELTLLDFPGAQGATEEALTAPEIARRRGEALEQTARNEGNATRIRATAEKDAASDRSEALKQMIGAQVERGVPPILAAMFATRAEEKIDIGTLVALRSIGVLGPEKPHTLAEAIALFQQLPADMQLELRTFFQGRRPI